MYTHNANARTAVLNGAAQGVTITITLASTSSIVLTEANIVSDSFYIDRASSTSGALPIGSATSNEVGFKINNQNGYYTNTNFEGASLTVVFYYYTDAGVRTYLCDGGKYYIIDSPVNQKIITVTAYGSLCKFDQISNLAGASASDNRIYSIFRDAASQCVGSATAIDYSAVSTLANRWLYGFQYPSGTDVTCRNLVGWAAACCGAMAREHGNTDAVQIIRYDNTGLTLNGSNTFENATWGKQVVPTGLIGYDANGVEYSAGSAGYEIELKSNGVFEQAYNQSSQADYRQAIITAAWNAISSITYTPISVTCVPMPWFECGDKVTFVDESNVSHTDVILTHIRYYLNGRTTIESSIENSTVNAISTALPSSVKRSSIETEMLRLNALKSINYVDLAGNFSTAGTFFDLANGVIKSKNFAITSVGDAIFKGIIQAYSGGKIGDLNITVDSVTGDTGLHYSNGDTILDIYPQIIRIAQGDNVFEINTSDGSLNINADIWDYDNDIETKLIIDNERFSVKFIDGDFTVHSGIEMTEAYGNLIGTWKHNGSPI